MTTEAAIAHDCTKLEQLNKWSVEWVSYTLCTLSYTNFHNILSHAFYSFRVPGSIPHFPVAAATVLKTLSKAHRINYCCIFFFSCVGSSYSIFLVTTPRHTAHTSLVAVIIVFFNFTLELFVVHILRAVVFNSSFHSIAMA